MTCPHQFIKVADVDKSSTVPTQGMQPRLIPGARIVCAFCGQVREVFGDSTFKLVIPGTEKPML